jgi:PAS domain S-box-containing protein
VAEPIDDAARLAAIVAYSNDAIISKDLNGIIQTWNRGAERLFGYTAEEAIGQPISLIIPEDRRQEEQEVLSRIREGLPVEHYETVRRGKDGRLIDISLMISPIRAADGRIVGASKIARDITERKQLRARLEEANRLKDEFLATLSHELRTPLNAVVGWAHMLAREQVPLETIRRGAEAILRNAQTQAQIVDDLLDTSRIVTGSLRLAMKPVSIAAVVREALEVVQPGAEGKRIHLVVEEVVDCDLVGDPVRLRQVMWNLLSNGVKFTPAGGTVRLSVKAEGDELVLTVSDTGQGITPEFMPYVFDRFRQEEGSIRRSSGGLGLGLSIVKHIVEGHGGRIEVESAGAGKGTTFTVRLPASASSKLKV